MVRTQWSCTRHVRGAQGNFIGRRQPLYEGNILPSRNLIWKQYASSSFSVPLRRREAAGVCAWCENRRLLECDSCCGSGRIASSSGGYHARNSIHLDRIVGSKWTALERTLGWRHFCVAQKMVVSNGKQFLLMVATCDERAKIWVPLDVVRCRDVWAPGWLQREALKKLIAERVEGSACGECGGSGSVACRFCCSPGPVYCL